MKTIKQVKEEYPEFKRIITAVLSNIDKSNIEDINNHGIDGGYGGFIYYSDTHKFAMRNRKQIIEMLENDADSFDTEIVDMVSDFGYFNTRQMENDDRRELYAFLGGGKCEPGIITNLMAWYAAETVCRWFEV